MPRSERDTDEEDIFESDFESTDEEAVQDDKDMGEKAVQDEEKQVRKVRYKTLAYSSDLHLDHSPPVQNWTRQLLLHTHGKKLPSTLKQSKYPLLRR